MSNKRVGLARTQALLENLKRALTLGSSTMSLESATSNKDVTITEGSIDIKNSEAKTQLTNNTTTVEINKYAGEITTSAAEFVGGDEYVFQVTNDKVAEKDVIILNHQAGSDGRFLVHVVAVESGLFKIGVANVGASVTEAIKINFAVIKAT